jgi:hypothetical protein
VIKKSHFQLEKVKRKIFRAELKMESKKVVNAAKTESKGECEEGTIYWVLSKPSSGMTDLLGHNAVGQT